jgi:hypothetical protein
MNCDICRDTKRVTLVRHVEMNAVDQFSDAAIHATFNAKEFDCPQCVPKVPYKRVRAMKVSTAYDAESFGKFQMPIERMLAARFGEYLLREGLIRFTQSGSKDFGIAADKITVTAHLGVVSPKDVEKSGAVAEVALTEPIPIPKKLTARQVQRLKVSPGSVAWKPKAAAWSPPDEPLTDEFDEPKSALGARFAGLEIG